MTKKEDYAQNMTLRDYFAAQCIRPFIEKILLNAWPEKTSVVAAGEVGMSAALAAYAFADAMLLAREAERTGGRDLRDDLHFRASEVPNAT